MSILTYVKSDGTGHKMLEVGGPILTGYWYRVWLYNVNGSAMCVDSALGLASALEAGVKAVDAHPNIKGIVTGMVDYAAQIHPWQHRQGPHIVHVPRLVSIPEAADALLKLRERADRPAANYAWKTTHDNRVREGHV